MRLAWLFSVAFSSCFKRVVSVDARTFSSFRPFRHVNVSTQSYFFCNSEFIATVSFVSLRKKREKEEQVASGTRVFVSFARSEVDRDWSFVVSSPRPRTDSSIPTDYRFRVCVNRRGRDRFIVRRYVRKDRVTALRSGAPHEISRCATIYAPIVPLLPRSATLLLPPPSC